MNLHRLLAPALALALIAPLAPADARQHYGTITRVEITQADPKQPLLVAVGPVHRYFGFLRSERGTKLMLALRSGRLVVVDASAAFASGRVSAPLYAGKPTVIVGRFAVNGVFVAAIVKRAAPNAASWDIDR